MHRVCFGLSCQQASAFGEVLLRPGVEGEHLDEARGLRGPERGRGVGDARRHEVAARTRQRQDRQEPRRSRYGLQMVNLVVAVKVVGMSISKRNPELHIFGSAMPCSSTTTCFVPYYGRTMAREQRGMKVLHFLS